MRSYGYLMVAMTVVFAGVWAVAEISLNQFQPGEVIRSGEVNENFEQLADALRDKQNRVSHECQQGSSIGAIHADGTVTCHVVGGDDGGLLSVASDATLAGDGTPTAPLRVAQGAITASELSDFGADPGQVLTYDGSSWQPTNTNTAGQGLTQSDNEFALDLDMTDARYLNIDDDGGFVASGALGQGDIPTQGSGTRLMWYPGKAAFRAGLVEASQWDDVRVGSTSFATGSGTIASGAASTAMGAFSTASGAVSTATGSGTIAAGAYSVAMGRFTRAFANEMVAIGRFNAPTGVTGSTAPDRPAFVVGNGTSDDNRSHALLLLANGDLRITGPMRVGSFPSSTGTGVCRTTNGTLAACSSSTRFKDDITELDPAAASRLLEQLRPVSFRWQDSELEDIGLIAEELAEIEPRLITYNDEGEIEGIKYRHLSAVLTAALQDLQSDYRDTVAAQQREIEALTARVTTLEQTVTTRLAALEQLAASGPSRR